MNIKQLLFAMAAFSASWAQQGSAAVTKSILADGPLRNFLFIENEADDNLFVTPTDVLDPRLTGGNAWTSLKGNGQVSLAYVDNGNNTLITGENVDIWEDGPISYPYLNQRCIMTYTGCDSDTAEALNKPAVVDERGFYGLMGASTGWGHAKISSNFFNYLNTMPVGSILNRQMNLCRTTLRYNAAAGERCIYQDRGNWYVRNMQHKKAGHLRFIQTNAITEVIVDSNGSPYILPGSQGCQNYSRGARTGVLCRFLDYSFNDDGSQTYVNPYMYTNIKNATLNANTVAADVQMSANLTTWVNRGGRYDVSNLRGKNSVYLFLSSNFFRQVVRYGLQDQLTRNLINFNMKNAHAPESGYYEFSGTTEVRIKPRDFSISILPSDGVTNPYREGKVGKDRLRFPYNIAESGPASANKLQVSIFQHSGRPYQGNCTFYTVGNESFEQGIPISTSLVFDSAVHGTASRHPIRCDGVPIDIRALAIKDSTPPQIWNDPVNGAGITRFYKVNLEFDLTNPMTHRNVEGNMWEGSAHQSGTISIKAIWG